MVAAVSGGLILFITACSGPASTASQVKQLPQAQDFVATQPAAAMPNPPPAALPEQTAAPAEPPCPVTAPPADVALYNVGYDIEATPAIPQTGFVFSQLQIYPELSVVDDNVTVSVNMTNPGDKPGVYQVNLNYGGVLVQTQNVTLEAGASKQVNFDMWAVYGEHAVTAGNVTAPTVMKVVY